MVYCIQAMNADNSNERDASHDTQTHHHKRNTKLDYISKNLLFKTITRSENITVYRNRIRGFIVIACI